MPATFDLILKNGKCFIDGQLKTIDIGISDGIIQSIDKVEKTSDTKVLDITNLTVSNLGTIKYIWTDDISAKFIRVDEISCNNNLYVNNKSSIHDGSFNYLNVDFDTSLNSLYAKDAVILEISANKLVIDELSANTIDVSNIISGGITVISGGTIGDPSFPQDAVFDNLVAKKLDISRVHITEYLDNWNAS